LSIDYKQLIVLKKQVLFGVITTLLLFAVAVIVIAVSKLVDLYIHMDAMIRRLYNNQAKDYYAL